MNKRTIIYTSTISLLILLQLGAISRLANVLVVSGNQNVGHRSNHLHYNLNNDRQDDEDSEDDVESLGRAENEKFSLGKSSIKLIEERSSINNNVGDDDDRSHSTINSFPRSSFSSLTRNTNTNQQQKLVNNGENEAVSGKLSKLTSEQNYEHEQTNISLLLPSASNLSMKTYHIQGEREDDEAKENKSQQSAVISSKTALYQSAFSGQQRELRPLGATLAEDNNLDQLVATTTTATLARQSSKHQQQQQQHHHQLSEDTNDDVVGDGGVTKLATHRKPDIVSRRQKRSARFRKASENSSNNNNNNNNLHDSDLPEPRNNLLTGQLDCKSLSPLWTLLRSTYPNLAIHLLMLSSSATSLATALNEGVNNRQFIAEPHNSKTIVNMLEQADKLLGEQRLQHRKQIQFSTFNHIDPNNINNHRNDQIASGSGVKQQQPLTSSRWFQRVSNHPTYGRIVNSLKNQYNSLMNLHHRNHHDIFNNQQQHSEASTVTSMDDELDGRPKVVPILATSGFDQQPSADHGSSSTDEQQGKFVYGKIAHYPHEMFDSNANEPKAIDRLHELGHFLHEQEHSDSASSSSSSSSSTSNQVDQNELESNKIPLFYSETNPPDSENGKNAKNYVYGRVLYRPSQKVNSDHYQYHNQQQEHPRHNHHYQQHTSSMSTLRHLKGQPVSSLASQAENNNNNNNNNEDESFGRILLSPSNNFQQRQQQQNEQHQTNNNYNAETNNNNNLHSINQGNHHIHRQQQYQSSMMPQKQTNSLTFFNGSNKPSTLHVLKQQLEPATSAIDRMNNITPVSSGGDGDVTGADRNANSKVIAAGSSVHLSPSSVNNNQLHPEQTSSTSISSQSSSSTSSSSNEQDEFEGTFISPAFEEADVTSSNNNNDGSSGNNGAISEDKNRTDSITVVKNSRNNFSVL